MLVKKDVFFKNQRGETLVSVLIAGVILLFILTSILSGVVNASKSSAKNLTQTSVCRQVASDVLTLIRSNGMQSKTFKAPINSQSIDLNDQTWHTGGYEFNSEGIMSEVGVPAELFSRRWPQQKIMNWETGSSSFTSHAPMLIQSSVNALATIYNASGPVCTNPKGIVISSTSILKDIAPFPERDNYSITASLRIRPFNINSGQILACSRPLRVRPYAAKEPPQAVADNILNLSNYRADVGFEVEVIVKTEHKGDKERGLASETEMGSHECSAKENFQYERLSEVPLAPTVSILGSMAQVSIDLDRFAPGSQLVCRSFYRIHDADANLEATRSVLMMGDTNLTVRGGGWLPCDRVPVCGQAPSYSGVNPEHSEVSVQYHLPHYCFMVLEARTMDIVGNLSQIQGLSYYSGNTYIAHYDPGSAGDSTAGYAVGAMNFVTLAAAQAASSISGIPITNITSPVNTLDIQVSSVATGLNSTVSERDTATRQAQTAESSLATAQSAATSATGSGTGAAGAAQAAGHAETAAASAAQAAAAAAEAAQNAQAAFGATQAAAASLNAAAGSTNPVSVKAVENAQAAMEAAEESARQARISAEEAARLAEEARRAAEEKARQESEGDNENNSGGP